MAHACIIINSSDESIAEKVIILKDTEVIVVSTMFNMGTILKNH